MSEPEQFTTFVNEQISDTIKDISIFLQPFREFDLHGSGVQNEVDFLIGAAVAYTMCNANAIFRHRHDHNMNPAESTVMRHKVFNSIDRFKRAILTTGL